MSDKKAYDKQVKKAGKIASFVSMTPLSPAAQKKRGTEITDASLLMDSRRPAALAKLRADDKERADRAKANKTPKGKK